MTIGIYKITSPSNKVYIGQSWDIKRRFRQYKNLHSSCKAQRKLYNSLVKYGFENHKIEVIQYINNHTWQEELDYWENLYWNLYKNDKVELLNIKLPGSKGKMSEETKELIRLKITGRKQSIEERKKHCGKNNGMYGKKGELAPFFGKHHTEEHKQMNRERMMGKKLSLGIKRSPEYLIRLTGGNNPSARKVINVDTGNIYSCIVDAAKDLNVSYSFAKCLVRNKIKNRKINLIYYEDWCNINCN